MSLVINLPIKPLSVNAAFQGRRFKTKESKEFDRAVQTLLLQHKKSIHPIDKYVVEYHFFLTNAGNTDLDNCVKCLQDNLVKAGMISDDRKIYFSSQKKEKAQTNSVMVKISALKSGTTV